MKHPISKMPKISAPYLRMGFSRKGLLLGQARKLTRATRFHVLFGALTKHPEYGVEGKNVLEKAQVILKRK